MSETAIHIHNLYKEYRLGVIGHGTLYRDMQSMWARWRGKEDPNGEIFRDQRKQGDRFAALKGISLEVQAGERLGIVGANGAGKSTLLKILSRVTLPTSGDVKIKGRVASLLEVGTGFHAELTGRENVYLNAAILGMSRPEVAKKFDEILAFAGVEDFIDTPVKRYSSGMYVRLGFAVAAHLDPDILIVDEVLAVGDAAFQKKCLGKLNDVSSSGRTVIFVSHNMDAVAELCSKCVWLDEGSVVGMGLPREIIGKYLQRSFAARTAEKTWDVNPPGNHIVRMRRVAMLNAQEENRSDFDVTEEVRVLFEFDLLEPVQLSMVIEVLDPKDHPILVAFDDYVEGPWGRQEPVKPGRYRKICRIPANYLNEGDHNLSLRIFSPPIIPNENPHVRLLHVLAFRISDKHEPFGARGSYPENLTGAATRPKLHWQTSYESI